MVSTPASCARERKILLEILRQRMGIDRNISAVSFSSGAHRGTCPAVGLMRQHPSSNTVMMGPMEHRATRPKLSPPPPCRYARR